MSDQYQRDVVIKSIFDRAKKNKDIFFISADFGAPAVTGVSPQHDTCNLLE